MPEITPEFFEKVKDGLVHSRINYMNVAGIIPVLAETRHVIARLPANGMHMNHVNIMYAGSYFVFAEATGAALLKCTYHDKYVLIIKSMEINYIKPTARDLVIDISMTEEEAAERIAYVKEHGKGRYPLDIPVMDADGETCADVHIVYYLKER